MEKQVKQNLDLVFDALGIDCELVLHRLQVAIVLLVQAGQWSQQCADHFARPSRMLPTAALVIALMWECRQLTSIFVRRR